MILHNEEWSVAPETEHSFETHEIPVNEVYSCKDEKYYSVKVREKTPKNAFIRGYDEIIRVIKEEKIKPTIIEVPEDIESDFNNDVIKCAEDISGRLYDNSKQYENIRFVPLEDSWKPIRAKVTKIDKFPLNLGE